MTADLKASDAVRTSGMKPRVYFICVGNAGRSQMAEGFARALGLDAASAGSRPASAIDANAVAAMREKGLDISRGQPKVVDEAFARSSDLVITMGCGDVCPYVPGTKVRDWALDDPKGQGLAKVREIRDEIERRVRALAAELAAARESGPAKRP